MDFMSDPPSLELQEQLVVYILPLQPFEKSLVQEASNFFRAYRPAILNDPQPTSSVFNAFHSWRWAKSVAENLGDFLGGNTLQEDYRGNRILAYVGYLHFLSHTDSLSRNKARIEVYRASNEDFLASLADRPVGAIQVIPAPEDEAAWVCLAEIYESFGKSWELPHLPCCAWDGFEIWPLVRMFAVHSLWPENMDCVYRVFMQDHDFQKYHEIRHPSGPRSHDAIAAVEESSGPLEQVPVYKKKQQKRSKARTLDDESDDELSHPMELFYYEPDGADFERFVREKRNNNGHESLKASSFTYSAPDPS